MTVASRPVSLASLVPLTLPKTQAEWNQWLTTLRSWAGSLQAGNWLAPTFKNSWTNYGGGYNPAGYYADLTGRVWLRGLLQGASQTAPSTLFTLPYAPQFRQLLQGIAYNGGSSYTQARIDVDTSGNVILDALASGSIGTGWLSLDSLSFSLSP